MKICFIGACGHSSQAYGTVRKRTDCKIAGVASGPGNETIPDAFVKEAKRYGDYKDMLDEICPDICVVSPIFGKTAEVTIECAKRGINVFSEKPVASNTNELNELEKTIRQYNTRFSAMHYLRFDPAFYTGADFVRNGGIGKVVMVNAQKSYIFGKRPNWYNDRDLYTGSIPWVGIHAIDWIYNFTGKRFLSVSALSVGNPEKTALCQYRLEDDVIASVNIDYYRPAGAPSHGDDYVRCVGTNGIIEVRYGRVVLIKDGISDIAPKNDIPDPFEEFLNGKDPIDTKELFYLTKVSLLSREAADTGKTIRIEE